MSNTFCMPKYYVIISITLILLVMSGCQQIGQYEGKTAQEWFNEYDSAETDNQKLESQISDLESEHYDMQVQYDDLESEKNDLESEKSDLESELDETKDKYDSLKSCVFIAEGDAEDCYYRY